MSFSVPEDAWPQWPSTEPGAESPEQPLAPRGESYASQRAALARGLLRLAQSAQPEALEVE